GCKIERGAITARQKRLLILVAAAPYRTYRVDHVPGLETITARDLGAAGVAATQRTAFGQQFRPGRAVNGAINAAAAQQRAVGGIHNCIDIERGDVGNDDVEDCLADLGGEPRHGPIISRACGFGCGLEIDRRAYTDVVVVCVEETARRASAVGT